MEKSQHSAQRIVFLLLFLVALLRPQLSGIAYPFIQGVLLVPLLVGSGLILLAGFQGPNVPKWGRLSLVASWVLLAWMFLTLLWTADAAQGVRECASLLLNVLAFTLVMVLVTSGKSPRAWWIALAVIPACLVAVRAFYQRFFGFKKLLVILDQMESGGGSVTSFRNIVESKRVFAGFLNPNMLAGFIAIFIPVFLDMALTAKVKGQKRVFTTLVLLLTCVLLMTGSVGGILAAVFMAMAVILVRKGMRSRLIFKSGALAAGLVVGALVLRGPGFVVGPESSITQRGGYMAAGIRMALEHPLLGWGAGSSPESLMGFVTEGFRPVTDPHNFLIRTWIAGGIPAVLFLLIVLISWAAAVSEGFRFPGLRGLHGDTIGLVFGSGAFILHSLFDMDFFVPETAFFGWCVMGAAIGTACVPAHGIESEIVHRLSWRRVLPGAMVFAAVLPSLIFFQGELTAFRADRMMREESYNNAVDLYRGARKLLPYNGRFALEQGRALMAMGDTDTALGLFRTADIQMKSSPYPPWELGLIALQRGDVEESIRQLERALKRYPTSPRIRIDLARAYLGLGDKVRAAELLRESVRYAVFDREAGRIAEEALDYLER